MNAAILLEKLFENSPSSLKNARELIILVIGAGAFPSYLALCKQLMMTCKELNALRFFLIEPNKIKTDSFIARMAHVKTAIPISSINFTIENIDLDTFLQKNHQIKFDLVYFEHPDMRTLTILFHKLLWVLKKESSLREAIPFLAHVLKPNTLLIASCLSRSELKQLQLLLKYGLTMQSKLIQLKKNDRYQGFCFGLYGVINNAPSIQLQSQRALMVKKSDSYFFLFFILSALIWCQGLWTTESIELNFIGLIILVTGLFVYRSGIMGNIIQAGFFILQILLFV